jgi:hypothetical protein
MGPQCEAEKSRPELPGPPMDGSCPHVAAVVGARPASMHLPHVGAAQGSSFETFTAAGQHCVLTEEEQASLRKHCRSAPFI